MHADKNPYLPPAYVEEAPLDAEATPGVRLALELFHEARKGRWWILVLAICGILLQPFFALMAIDIAFGGGAIASILIAVLSLLVLWLSVALFRLNISVAGIRHRETEDVLHLLRLIKQALCAASCIGAVVVVLQVVLMVSA